MAMQTQNNQEVLQEFKSLVNMTPKKIEDWLETEESQKVGFTNEGEKESVGHQSGKKIIRILHTQKTELTEDDYHHMHKVISYIKRHSAQKPAGDIAETPWRYSLMNWGHDPLKG